MEQIRVVHENLNSNFTALAQCLEKAQTVSVGFFLFDFYNKTIEFTKQTQEVIPLPAEGWVTVEELLEPFSCDDVQRIRAFFTNMVQGNAPREQMLECRVQSKTSMPVWIRCTLRQICGQDGSRVLLGIVENITDEVNYKLIVESCMDGIFIGDLRHNQAILAGSIFNEICLKSGYYNDISGLIKDGIVEEDKEYHRKHVEDFLSAKSELNRIEYRMYDNSNNPVWVSSRNRVIYDKQKEPVMVIGGYININKLRSYTQYVEAAADTCEITGLHNVHRLQKDLQKIAEQPGSHGYVIAININGYTALNSALGSKVGKIFLQELGESILHNRLFDSAVYHYEPGKFMLVMQDATVEEASAQMEHIKMITALPFIHEEATYPYSLAMIAVQYKEKGAMPEEILGKCAVAMQKVKSNRRSSCKFFKKQHLNEYQKKVELESNLQDCVANGMKDFFVLYQPFIGAENSRCIGVEALLRWKDKDGSVVSPVVFIPCLEKLGLMDTVGEWVFKKASTQCKEWTKSGFGQDFYVSINASTPQLDNKDFAKMVLQHLKTIDLCPKNIVIEITESEMMQDFQRGMKQLIALRKNGVRLAIDDFGTGYSSLSYLKTLPVDEIKIDRSFIKDIEFDAYSREFVASIIKITQSVGRIICLEGVETAFQMEILKEMKSDVFQGFLFGRPQEAQELEGLYYTYNRKAMQ